MAAKDRREELIAAAFRVMVRDGVTKATARAIVNEAKMPLGAVQFVPAEAGVLVANMIGQHGYRPSSTPPVRYEAIGSALATVADRALQRRASVHMPRIGCGLAGGRWELVEPLIVDKLTRRGVPVTVYDLA
jgi:hypothetical protein